MQLVLETPLLKKHNQYMLPWANQNGSMLIDCDAIQCAMNGMNLKNPIEIYI